MLKSTTCIVLACILMAIIAACAGTANTEHRIDYYTLEYPPPVMDDLKPLPYALRIETFTINPVYDTNRIVFREAAHQREAYVYHRWRAKPAVLAMYYMARDMRKSGLFEGVFIRGAGGHATHVVEGTVDEFYEKDSSEGWEAVLEITITLLVAEEPDVSKRILFQRQFSVSRKCASKTPGAVVEAMSNGMAEISEAIIRELHKSLEGTG